MSKPAPERSQVITPRQVVKAGGRLPALDGLRGFALLGMLAWHAQLEWVRGGFARMTIFFVLSGYLAPLLFGVIAFAIGAASGRRSVAVSVSAGLAVATYLLQGLLTTAAHAPAAVINLTPWHWYLDHNMLIDGVAIDALVLPAIVGAAAIALGAPLFVRRDLT